MHTRMFLAGMAAILLITPGVYAQATPQTPQTPRGNTTTAETPQTGADAEEENPNRVIISRGSGVAEAVADMARVAGATVVVDPALLNSRVSGATAKLPLEQGLNAIAQQYRAKWRKVYLDEKQLPRTADGKVDARRLKAIVEAAQAAPAQTVGVVDPATGLMTVTSRAAETAPAMVAWAKGQKPIYLLYMPGAEPAPRPATAGPGGMMPPGGVEEFRKMTPEQRKKWMDEHGGVIITSDMSPEERAAALQRLPPGERERLQRRLQEGGGDQVMVFRQEERHEP